MRSDEFQSFTYQLFAQGTQDYFQVPVYVNGDTTQGFTRFFLENDFTDSSKLSVVQSMEFVVTLNTDGELVNPSLYVTYVTLSLEPGIGITP